MRSLTEIIVKVEHYEDTDKHSEITVESVIFDAWENGAAFGNPTNNQLLAAATQVAGLLARVALVAQQWMAYEAQQCRCPQTLALSKIGLGHAESTDVCSIGYPDVMLRPNSDLGDHPAVWFYVPATSVDAWLERIRDWLEAATAADADRAEEPKGHPGAAHVDHIIPVRQAPELLMVRNNLRLSHAACNQRRRTRLRRATAPAPKPARASRSVYGPLSQGLRPPPDSSTPNRRTP